MCYSEGAGGGGVEGGGVGGSFAWSLGQKKPQRWPLLHGGGPHPEPRALASWGFSQTALQRLPRPRKRAPGGSQEQGSEEEPLPRTVGARSPGRGQGLGPPMQCGRPRFNPWVGKIPWRRKWQPTPVLMPGKFHGWRSEVFVGGRRETLVSLAFCRGP